MLSEYFFIDSHDILIASTSVTGRGCESLRFSQNAFFISFIFRLITPAISEAFHVISPSSSQPSASDCRLQLILSAFTGIEPAFSFRQLSDAEAFFR